MKSIKGKMLVMTVSIVLTISIVSLFISSWLSYQNTINTLKDSLTEAVEIAAGKVDSEISGYKRLIYTFSQDSIISDISLPFEQRFNQLKKNAENSGFSSYGLTNKDGFTSENQTNLSQTVYFKACKETGQPYVSEPIVMQDKKSAIIIMAAPIDVNNSFEGIVLLGMDASYLTNIVSQISVGERGNSAILNKNGETIAYNDYQLVLDKYCTQNEVQNDPQLKELAAIERRMMNGETDCGEYIYDNVKKLMAFAPIQNSDGWSIDVAVVKSDFMHGLWQSIITNVIVTIIIIIISIAFVMQMSNKISKPIKKCVERLVLLSKGDLHTKVPKIHTKDEIETLLNAMDTTVSSLNADISDVSYHLNEIANGNLSESITRDYQGDFKRLEDSLKLIIKSLNDDILQISQTSEEVSNSSQNVSSGAQILAQGSSEQASSIQQLAETINKISGQIEGNAKNATEATDIINHTGKELEASNHQMKEMVNAMNDITNTSGEIGKIIKTIDDIAFQTNILALNAAVEAARAGEAGKGFAVVADEVRNLATKSSEAAKSTTLLIESSLKAIEMGTEIADKTAESLLTVVESTKSTISAMDKISDACNEQASSISEVTEGMNQISNVVQSNSATAEESAATSEELSGQAQVLKSLVQRFKIKQNNYDNTSLEYHSDMQDFQ